MTLIINNQPVTASGQEFSSLTPCQQQTLWTGNAATEQEVNQAVDAARSAFKTWANTDFDNRVALCERFAQNLIKNQSTLAELISLETGKPLWEATTEVSAMANKVAISVASYRERTGSSNNGNLALNHRPHGVMAVFGPYNFPGHLPNGHIVPALLAGNTIVFKPSEQTPATAELTIKIWIESGLPKGVINLVQGLAETGIALAAQNIDGLLFTGSSTTGKLIHKQFGGRPEVLLALEMGGNNALIHSSTENLDRAAETILNSAFLSAGQRCTCARRLILIKSAQTSTLLAKLKSLAERIIVDSPTNTQEAFMGPVINRVTAEHLLATQDELISHGGQPITTMRSIDHTGVRLSPGIIDVTNINDRQDEEFFGPLLQVIQVNNLDEAIAEANNTSFGLAAGLLSDNESEHQQFLTHIRAGVTSINAPTAGASSALPFGGIGASGNHRPSAYYAADYCAWPQANMKGDITNSETSLIARGLAE